MEKILRLYTYVDGINDPPFPSKDEQIETSSFRFDTKRMGSIPTISATIKHRLCLDKLWTENVYAEFNSEKYFIKNVPTSSYDNKDTRYVHELNLVSERFVLANVYFYDVVTDETENDKPVSNSSSFSFYGDIHEFARRLDMSLKYRGVDYSVVVDDGVTSESKMLSFKDQFFINAIQESFNVFEIPYYFVGRVLHFGFSSNTITKVMKYGDKESLLSIKKQNANFKIVNKVTGIGSEDNIPYYYPNDYESKEQVEANGGTWINPQRNLMPSIYRKTLGAERFYEAKNNTYKDESGKFINFDNEYKEGNPREHIVSFDNIKPTIKGIPNASGQRIDSFLEFAYDQNDSDEIDAEGNYLHPYFFAKMKKTDGAFGFNLFDQAIDESDMTISMTSGNCGACEFIVGVDKESKKNVVQVDELGNLKRDSKGDVITSGTPQDAQNNTMTNEVWIALKKDIKTFGVVMPNATNKYRPSVGDTFVILHIKLPKAYILAAEDHLDKELIKYMASNNSDKFNFSILFSRIFFAENPDILAQLNENAIIQIEYDNQKYELYVSSYSYKMESDKPLPEISVELTDTLTIAQNAIQTAINEIKRDISLGGFGGGGFDYKTGLKYFLRKDIDDYANGKITFNKGLQSKGDATFAKESFVDGFLGRGGKIDGEGRAELQSMMIREELIVPKITFNCIDAISGDKANTFAFGTIKSVDTESQIATLDLLNDQLGTLHASDICRGVFHNISDPNDVEDIEDENGFYKYSGFSTSYFSPTEILVNKVGEMKFKYIIKEGTNTHPMVGMNFFAYGNFVDSQRQAITYETRYYTRRLKNMNTWKIDPNVNISMQTGLIEGLVIGGMEMHGYGTFQENNYFTGTTIQFTPEQQDKVSAYSISLSSENGVVKVDSVGNIIEPLTLQTTLSVSKGSIKFTQGDSPSSGKYIVGLKSVGCSAKCVDGVVSITDLTKEGSVEITINCEGVYSTTRKYSFTSVSDGKDGKGAVVASLDNENASVISDNENNVTFGLPLLTHVNMWGDGELLPLTDLSVEDYAGVVVEVNKSNKEVKVTSISKEAPKTIRLKVRATAFYGGKTQLRNFIFTINKIQQGSDAEINELYLPYTASNQALGIKSIKCQVKRTNNKGVFIYDTLDGTGLNMTYAKNDDSFVPYTYGGFIPISEEDNYVKFRLIKGDLVIDTQTFLVIRNGQKGDKGDTGEPSVTYEIITDHSVIKKDKDGNIGYDYLNFHLNEISGNTTTKCLIPQGYKYELYIDGVLYQSYNAGYSSEKKVEAILADKEFEIRLSKSDGTLVDSETIPVLSDGLQGPAAILMNLTNDNANVECDYQGIIVHKDSAGNIEEGYRPYTIASIYNGTTKVKIKKYEVASRQPVLTQESYLDGSQMDLKVSVFNLDMGSLDREKIEITLYADINGVEERRTIPFFVSKAKNGEKGKDGEKTTIYSIVTSHSVIKRFKNGTSNTTNVSFQINEKDGKVINELKKLPAGYKLEIYYDGVLNTTILGGKSCSGSCDVSGVEKSLELKLLRVGNSSDILVDAETIPVLRDGDGESPILINLSNDNASVECDANGNVIHVNENGYINTGFQPSTTAVMYNGTEEITIKKYQLRSPNNKLSAYVQYDNIDIKKKATVYIRDINPTSADREPLDITLFADINGIEYSRTATFYINKVKNGKQGANGENGKYYQDIFILSNTKPSTPSSGYSIPDDWSTNIPHIEYQDLKFRTTNEWSLVNSYLRSKKIASSGFTKERITFNFTQETYIDIEMTSHSEARYDVGFIGKLDTNYTSKPSDSNILNKASGDNVKVHSYVRVPSGSHFIEVMYTKDSSGDKFGDYVDVRVISLKRIWESRSEVTYESSSNSWHYRGWSKPSLYNVESGEERIYILSDLKKDIQIPYSDPDINNYLPLVTYNEFSLGNSYSVGDKVRYNQRFYECILDSYGFSPTNTEHWKEIQTWTRTPQDINDKYKYQYICVRKQNQTVWGSWSKPVLFTSVGEKGKDGEGALLRDRGFFTSGERYYWKGLVVDGQKKIYRDMVVAKVGERYFHFVVRHFGTEVTAAPTISNGEQAGTGGDDNWELMSEYKTLVVNTLFGKNANIGGFMTTDERFESSSQVDGKPKFEINGRQGTQVMRQDGGTEWNLNENGVQSVGKPNGERVVIDPSSKSISIYDEGGSERANFNGKSYTRNDLITSGNLTFTKTSNAVSNISRDKTLSHGNNDIYEERINLTNSLYVSSPESVQVSLSNVSIGLEDRSGLNPNNSVSDYARLDIFLDIFSDSSLTKRVSYKLLKSVECRVKKGGSSSSTYPSSLGNIYVSLDKGYCIFAARMTMIAVNRVIGTFSWDFNVGSIAKDNFISRYFSNGFCLSRSTKDYVTALSENNHMLLEAVSNGFGARVYDGNFSIKHSESQQWFNMPKILFVANVQAVAYNNYNVKIKTFDGNAITFSGGVGRCSFRLPYQWSNLGISPANVIANATSYGRINGDAHENVCWASIEYISSSSIDVRTAFGKGSDYNTCGFFLEVRLL